MAFIHHCWLLCRISSGAAVVAIDNVPRFGGGYDGCKELSLVLVLGCIWIELIFGIQSLVQSSFVRYFLNTTFGLCNHRES
jgi:hypothetical protein